MGGIIPLLSRPAVNADTVFFQPFTPNQRQTTTMQQKQPLNNPEKIRMTLTTMIPEYVAECSSLALKEHTIHTHFTHRQRDTKTETHGQADRLGVGRKDREMPFTKK